MLTGMPSTEIARSVPWSRLKPRRKYWLALPSPLCCVTIRPGTTSSASAGRENGHALTSAPLTFFSLDELIAACAAVLELAAELPLPAASGVAIARRVDRLPRSAPGFGLLPASRRGCGAITSTGGSAVAPASAATFCAAASGTTAINPARTTSTRNNIRPGTFCCSAGKPWRRAAHFPSGAVSTSLSGHAPAPSAGISPNGKTRIARPQTWLPVRRTTQGSAPYSRDVGRLVVSIPDITPPSQPTRAIRWHGENDIVNRSSYFRKPMRQGIAAHHNHTRR